MEEEPNRFTVHEDPIELEVLTPDTFLYTHSQLWFHLQEIQEGPSRGMPEVQVAYHRFMARVLNNGS